MARKRNRQVNFRLTGNEKALLEKKVQDSGLNQQEYLARCVLEKEIINMEPLRKLVPEMKKQGVNLNQIAKKLNSQGYVDYSGELKSSLEEVQQTWQSLRQYLHTHQ